MKVQFWGVRGAIPTPGRDYLRYGGNTCCIAVTGSGGEMVVIEAGTGFCQLGDALVDGPFGRGEGQMVLLLSNTYWDHILGFPFPGIIHRPGNRFDIYGPSTTSDSLEVVCDTLLSPVYSPVYSLANINAQHVFHAVTVEPLQVGSLTLQAQPLIHPEGEVVWAYQITENNRRLVYITDVHYVSEGVQQAAVAFAQGAHLLIHAAPYMRSEAVHDYRYGYVEDAIDVALLAQVDRLILFKHAPHRTDDRVDTLLAYCQTFLAQRQATLSLDAAREGDLLEV